MKKLLVFMLLFATVAQAASRRLQIVEGGKQKQIESNQETLDFMSIKVGADALEIGEFDSTTLDFHSKKLRAADGTDPGDLVTKSQMETALAGASGSIGSPIGGGAVPGSILFVDVGPILAQDNGNLFWDNTSKRLGVGTSSPSTTLSVQGTLTSAFYATDANALAANFVANNATNVDASSSTQGVLIGANITVAGGVTDGGEAVGLTIQGTRGDATDTGSLATLSGLVISEASLPDIGGVTHTMNGVRVNQTVGGGHVDTVWGYRTKATVSGATLDTYYGLDIEDTTAIATNDYGVFQRSAFAKNYFNGKVGFGTFSPLVATNTFAMPGNDFFEDFYLTADETTDYSRARFQRLGNIFNIVTESGGAGLLPDWALTTTGKNQLESVSADGRFDWHIDGAFPEGQPVKFSSSIGGRGYEFMANAACQSGCGDGFRSEWIFSDAGVGGDSTGGAAKEYVGLDVRPLFQPQAASTATYVAAFIHPEIAATSSGVNNYIGLKISAKDTAITGTDNRLLDVGKDSTGTLFVVKDDGRTGIGTTSPDPKVQISWDATNVGMFGYMKMLNTTNDRGILLTDVGGGSYIQFGGTSISAGFAAVLDGTIDGASISLMRGNVGISDGSSIMPPFAAKLEISGATDDNTKKALQVDNHSAETLFVVRNDGEVGVGANPTANLDVTGNGAITLTGSAAVTGGTNSVTGVSTLFLSELKIGDSIKLCVVAGCPSGSEAQTVASISGDTALTTVGNFSGTFPAGSAVHADDDLFSIHTSAGSEKILVNKTGAVTISDAGGVGGNVPHACHVVAGGAGVTTASCVAGEVAMSGSVDCGNTALFVTKHSGTPAGGPWTGWVGDCVTNTTILVEANCCAY